MVERHLMASAESYRRSAEEALRWASRATTEKERKALKELGRKCALLAQEIEMSQRSEVGHSAPDMPD
jgi:hypothetical protein